MRPFTCQAACEDKLRRHGPSTREDPQSNCSAFAEEELVGRWAHLALPQLSSSRAESMRSLWEAIDAAFFVRRPCLHVQCLLPCRDAEPATSREKAADGLDTVLPPGARGFGGGPDVDFVAAGLRMTDEEVARARAQWRTFLAAVPAYPDEAAAGLQATALFQGRGVVMIGYVLTRCMMLHCCRSFCSLSSQRRVEIHAARLGGGPCAARRRVRSQRLLSLNSD